MVQGTASSVGKSTLVAGLCRWLAQRGLRVAPFKAQNMSNNAAVCADGGEIGRAQFAQAVAAGIEPTVDMNPILLKPQGRTSQVIVRGRAQGAQTAAEYFGPSGLRGDLWPTVAEALDRLRSTYDLVIAEGAGSPAEINLRDRDLVNMRVALHAAADVFIVSDIDRGGAFAALLGTWEWLAPDERALVRGFILNKFRGDPTLLAPAPAVLEQRTGVPVIGVVPYLDNLVLPEEDAASLTQRSVPDARVEIAVVRLPHLANFDEFGLLAAEPGVSIRYVSAPEALRAPDLVIVPGTKATIPDLLWLHDRGLTGRLRWLVTHGTPVLGICGGYQMLGQVVRDPRHVESEHASAVGLGLLSIETELAGADSKRLARTRGVVRPNAAGIWAGLSGVEVEGYEIHVGRTWGQMPDALLDLPTGPDGSVTPDGLVAGTYLHGIFEHAAARHALLRSLASRRGLCLGPVLPAQLDPYADLARVLADTVRLDTTRVPALLKTLA
ncbi:MAG TPA: cobyric acid synthase [Chloroflexota bacterium]|nr:cobyric acid synthase [Chloroflexota bacterium]